MDYFPGNHKYGENSPADDVSEFSGNKVPSTVDGSEIPNNQLGFLEKTLGK